MPASPESARVRVRFAPSPTGYLHIGGARTALFNFLFARHHQGTFLLRIEDTDRLRSDPAMTAAIFRSLSWLGLTWDEEPVFQSSRTERHRSLCNELLNSGKAYYCFCTPEELDEKRGAAKAEYRYDRACLSLSKTDVADKLRSGASKAVRIRIPEGETAFRDRVRGDVTVLNREIDDFILLRSDGQPVYQVAVVADDHDMGITHVIRGDDHLSNTPKQILLYRAFGWDVPEFAHVPMILGTDKKRLSKRHGATSVEEFDKAGYLPESLVNMLALLGWSPGEDREIMDMEFMIKNFSLDAISRNAAVFDEKKLDWMNAQYIQKMDGDALLKKLAPRFMESGLTGNGPGGTDEDNRKLEGCIRLFRPRAKRLSDFVESSGYFFSDPGDYDAAAVQAHWPDASVHGWIESATARLKNSSEWKTDSIEKIVRETALEIGVPAGRLIHALRLAVTGRGASPGLFEVMEVIGKDSVLRRLDSAVLRIQGPSDGKEKKHD
jgi:glutamyl-tRNA synthetase